MNAKPRVLLFESSLSPKACRFYEAIGRVASERNWDLHAIEYNIVDEHLKMRPIVGIPNLHDIVDLWCPDGVIVECSGRKPQLPLEQFGRIPVVLLDCHPSQSDGHYSCVYADATDIVKAATGELLSLGLQDYTFVPYLTQVDWSTRREAEFERLVQAGCRRFIRFPRLNRGTDMVSIHQILADGLKTLPHPCGIMAASDEMARYVVTACGSVGLSVPGDISIVGVDNDVRLCENQEITLSSVNDDSTSIGFNSANLLGDIMSKVRKGPIFLACHSAQMVRRMSTYRFRNADAHLVKALEFIRLNACLRVTPNIVAREMGCSRRFADRRFVEILGHTVQEELHAVRLAKVKELLLTPKVSLSIIPDLSGYNSMTDLCRDFKKRTGVTMKEWRASKA